jgi:shikimate 5-dehydrogenase
MSDKYAVVGNPIDHTKSPLIYLSFAKETGQDIDYVALRLLSAASTKWWPSFGAQGV